jgi:hypothetical protein
MASLRNVTGNVLTFVITIDRIKNPGLEVVASRLFQRGFLKSFLDPGLCWSNGVVE